MSLWQTALAVFSLILSGVPGNYFTQVKVTHSQVEYVFGDQVRITARVQADAPITEVQVFIRILGDATTISGQAQINKDQISYTYDLIAHPLRAFTELEYWYVVKLQNNQDFSTSPERIYYEDNRFDWQTLENGIFLVHWYDGEPDLGQRLLDTAQAGLQRIQAFLPLPIPEKVNIYVYANSSDLQSTLQLGGLDWIAGHSEPDLGVMLVSLPPGPGQGLEAERQIPHELMHILSYQAIGPRYEGLPAWLREGLASLAELNPNPDYYTILTKAAQEGTLIPIRSFCDRFPTDASSVYLAYAESASFTSYLHSRVGVNGLHSLINAYGNGLACESGVEQSLGIPLDELDVQWKQANFGEVAFSRVVQSLLPWFTILFLIMGMPILIALLSVRKRTKKVTQSGLVDKEAEGKTAFSGG